MLPPSPRPQPRAKSASSARLSIATAILHLQPSYAKILATPLSLNSNGYPGVMTRATQKEQATLSSENKFIEHANVSLA